MVWDTKTDPEKIDKIEIQLSFPLNLRKLERALH